MTPKQCRAARALLKWSQTELADKANVGLSTVRDFEKERHKPIENNLRAMIAALDSAGIQFLETGDTAAGQGVALKL
ncbi:helix-turn-helix domain-containing protein [Maritalea sp. S77]|uniref:helix-turn-helix domain-containing protein n=1 Tax=Maritalea sp. S77 TaxID=3415125 RepID=UPI003C7C362E